MDLIGLGLKVIAIDLGGVFSVLIIFYALIKGLLKVFPPKEDI
ncbi:MAG: OadG-related small transporter subunit [Dehalobacterium sp.]|jgi:hypothetical protein